MLTRCQQYLLQDNSLKQNAPSPLRAKYSKANITRYNISEQASLYTTQVYTLYIGMVTSDIKVDGYTRAM